MIFLHTKQALTALPSRLIMYLGAFSKQIKEYSRAAAIEPLQRRIQGQSWH